MMHDNNAEDKDRMLEQKLREAFLFDENNSNENLYTMEANFIFSNAYNPQGIDSRSVEIINRLEKEFLGSEWKKGLWGLIILSIISFGIYWKLVEDTLDVRSRTETIVKAESNSIGTPAPMDEDPVSEPMNTVMAMDHNRDSIALEDSVTHDSIQAPGSPGMTYQSRIAESQVRITGDKYLYPAPDKTFKSSVDPSKYSKANSIFKVDTNAARLQGYYLDQKTFNADYYKGAPFKKPLDGTTYFNFGEYIVSRNEGEIMIPLACYGHVDPYSVRLVKDPYGILFPQLPMSGISKALQPFYFSNTEVSNKKYKEFVAWVKESNGYSGVPVVSVKTDTILVTDPKEKYGEIVRIKDKDFKVIRHVTALEDLSKVYSYQFFNKEMREKVGKQVFVLPDTTRWTNDFKFSYNQPMVDLYFWHPAYDEYPVVGVSWFQAMAYLDWLTYMHQKELDKEGVPYVIEYTLPSEIEWEIVSISNRIDSREIKYDLENVPEATWITDLGVIHSDDDFAHYNRTSPLKRVMTRHLLDPDTYVGDGYFHTAPVDVYSSGFKKNASVIYGDPLNISWMGGNVSEWMLENYPENFETLFNARQIILTSDEKPELMLLSNIEKMFNKGNDPNGKLIAGANWYDERVGAMAGSERNNAGISAKRYVDPSEQHSTVGFRYVVHVRMK